MILVDANILLYAYNPSSEHHASCRAWLEQALSSAAPVGMPWLTVWAFLRISTNPRAFEKPLSIKEAASAVTAWFEQSMVHGISPGERYWEILSGLLVDAQVVGPLVTDAALAALAIENGASICTTDRDFVRFTDVTIMNPTRD